MPQEYDIALSLLNDMSADLQPKLQRAYNRATNKIKKIVKESIINSLEYQSMLPGGAIYHELGIPNIASKLRTIVNTIINNIDAGITDIDISNGRINFSFHINILRSDFEDILGLPEAEYETEDVEGSGGGHILQWLRWMLIDGDSNIILGYHYIAKYAETSRTDFGIMAKGGNWTISPISGSIDNNWLTRAMDKVKGEINFIIEDEVARAVI